MSIVGKLLAVSLLQQKCSAAAFAHRFHADNQCQIAAIAQPLIIAWPVIIPASFGIETLRSCSSRMHCVSHPLALSAWTTQCSTTGSETCIAQRTGVTFRAEQQIKGLYMNYNPDVPPNSALWLELDEAERITAVIAHHKRSREELPNQRLHATIHVIIENQLA
jgi:hypothetical protein